MNQSGIRDNHSRGNVGEFLKEKIREGSKLSFVSAYFTIYAHHALKEELGSVATCRKLHKFFEASVGASAWRDGGNDLNTKAQRALS
jgi:hypothetical protein